MTYYINPIWFYLMDVSIGVKVFLCVFGVASLVTSVVALIGLALDQHIDITNLENNERSIIKLFEKIIIASIIAVFIGFFVPSKKACIEMMIASQLSHENVTATKEEIYEIIDYVTDKVNEKDNQ